MQASRGLSNPYPLAIASPSQPKLEPFTLKEGLGLKKVQPQLISQKKESPELEISKHFHFQFVCTLCKKYKISFYQHITTKFTRFFWLKNNEVGRQIYKSKNASFKWGLD